MTIDSLPTIVWIFAVYVLGLVVMAVFITLMRFGPERERVVKLAVFSVVSVAFALAVVISALSWVVGVTDPASQMLDRPVVSEQ